MRFEVNGVAVSAELKRSTPLLPYLRNDLALNGPKFGCGLGECGACNVLVDGKVARACVLTLGHVEGRAVTTLEGMRDSAATRAFVECAAAQCGYCLNGMIMTATALIDAIPQPSEAQIREALRYNLCRCGAHVEIIAAVKRTAELSRA